MNPSTALAITKPEPLISIGSVRQAREQRATTLADHFVKFISEHIDLLVQVRQDFIDKDKNEAIMGRKTWTEYCASVLHYSESHIRNLIAGRVTDAAKHNGTQNRKPRVLVLPPPSSVKVPPELEKNNPGLAEQIKRGEVVPRDTSYLNEPNEPNLNGDYFRHLGGLLDGVFKGQIQEKLDVLCGLPKSKITPKIKKDAQAMEKNLRDLIADAQKYVRKIRRVSKARVA